MIKRKMIVLPAVLGLAVGNCWAQSSVTLWGVIDGGVSYVSNEGGGHSVKFDDGVVLPNLLKFTGQEDLGGGTKAVFDLTNQFSLGTGSFIPGQSLFSRLAYVGLEDARFGRLTFGNQYDFMFDSLVLGFNDAAYYTGLYSVRNGPFNNLALPNNPTGAFDWDRTAGLSISNSVKYQSPVFAGFSFGGMYGFGNVAGSIGASNGSSFGLNYVMGAFGANAAYTLVKTATPVGQVSVRNWGVGAHYHLGPVTANTLLTTVHNNQNGAGVWETEVGGLWQINGPCSLLGAYSYMKGNAVLNNDHAHQLTAMFQYSLSKRTSVYSQVVYQWANEGANAQINGVFVPSSTSSQFVARIGMTTQF
ncbi:MAG TPA: porin [Paraburkholderia sp.]|uniref:porin n=1 Tax=Paraburkholderia sp. TaxID=1926495 RepID=UPI002B462C47|nr:porin [Paraburkholderia sp.]HKR47691.1 porin [Paraburkholderia sp.]